MINWAAARNAVRSTALLCALVGVIVFGTHYISAPGAAAETSEEFFDGFSAFEPAPALEYNFRSLSDLTGTVDLVVRGHVADVYIGDEWIFTEGTPAVPLAFATIAIDDVLKGTPISRDAGAVEVLLMPVGDDFDTEAVSLPREEGLWFLLYEPTYRAALGKSAVTSPIAPFVYFRPNFFQTVLSDQNGLVDVPLDAQIGVAYGLDAFPLALQGLGFDSVESQVRELAQAPEEP